MKKADLKTGMIVTYRNGSVRNVDVEDRSLNNAFGEILLSLDCYDENLMCQQRHDNYDRDLDIVSVSGILWQRPCEQEYVCAKCGEKMPAPVQYREAKRVAKVGEKIKIVDAHPSRYQSYANGDTFDVIESVSGAAYTTQYPKMCILRTEYVVLERT